MVQLTQCTGGRRKNLEIARTELGVSAGFFPQVKSMLFCKA